MNSLRFVSGLARVGTNNSVRCFSAGNGKKKTTQLRELFESKDLGYLMEAHNGLSAKIVQEAGFKAIWASGLSISAALGVRDSNEASWTQVLDVMDFMTECTDIPILLDGDTGYGNFNNARRLIGKLERVDVAGVCLEDKLFPKTNSFIDGELQPLADIGEFCGKIMACKDTQKDPDFMVVARLEAFITGYGLEEAYKRADAYHRAGADAILCHSKKSNDSDIADFMGAWGDRCPVVIVPTKYPNVPVSRFEDLGVSAVIWANHNMRASVHAMQQVTKEIFEKTSLATVEAGEAPVDIVKVSEVFRLQNTAELKEAENKYDNKESIAARMGEIPE
jgi:phosphoenolpyruvate phosphomutase